MLLTACANSTFLGHVILVITTFDALFYHITIYMVKVWSDYSLQLVN